MKADKGGAGKANPFKKVGLMIQAKQRIAKAFNKTSQPCNLILPEKISEARESKESGGMIDLTPLRKKGVAASPGTDLFDSTP